ncbi:hypothetical protein [Thermoflexibacter ruber]|uniref:Uncharacterized protein n=1 Tax=Thermoflexibacter ruber TaxID=1003 RepID=A0A1I2J0B6_9BACT|nr:hypothetical protein [Thermoflexibacter ruber]SFF48105.1 hypothetical protein SAMN04488541_10404 [Thermoflexibacter ruber]
MSKFNTYFSKFSAKAPSQIHQPNQFAESSRQSRELGYYEEAIKDLEPLPYAVSYRFVFLLAKLYANAYHIVSTLLGLACIYLLVNVFVGFENMPKGVHPIVLWGIAILLSILLIVLLVGIEMIKGNLSNTFFRNKVIKNKNKSATLVGLVGMMTISILISAVGGAVISLKTSDKTGEIKNIYLSQSDSIRNYYQTKIQTLQAEINATNQLKASRLKRSPMWGLTKEESNTLNHNKTQLAKLENQLQSDLLSLKSDYQGDMTKNLMQSTNAAWVVAGIVFVLEMLLLWAYSFQWEYRAEAKAEAVNFQVLELEKKASSKNEPKIEKIDNDYDKMKEVLQQLINGQQNFQIASTNAPVQPQKVGYKFGLQAVHNEAEKLKPQHEFVLREGNRVCLHCGNLYEYKIHNQKFCSEKCRVEAWQQKTGKVLKKAKKE